MKIYCKNRHISKTGITDKFDLRGNHVVAEHAGQLMRRIHLMAQWCDICLSPSIADAVVAYTLRIFNIRNYDPKMLKIREKDIRLILACDRMKKIIIKTYNFNV